MLSLPNLPDPDLKPGGKENNEPLRYFGEPHKFDFAPEAPCGPVHRSGPHRLRAGRQAGRVNGFWIYTRPGRPAGVGAAELLHRRATWPTAMSSSCPPTCWSTSAARPPASSPSSPMRSIRSQNPTDRPRPLHAAHRRGCPGQRLPGRDPHRGGPAQEISSPTPPASAGRPAVHRRRGARHGPRPPVQQGRDVPVHPPGGLRRGLRRAGRQGREPGARAWASTSAP